MVILPQRLQNMEPFRRENLMFFKLFVNQLTNGNRHPLTPRIYSRNIFADVIEQKNTPDKKQMDEEEVVDEGEVNEEDLEQDDEIDEISEEDEEEDEEDQQNVNVDAVQGHERIKNVMVPTDGKNSRLFSMGDNPVNTDSEYSEQKPMFINDPSNDDQHDSESVQSDDEDENDEPQPDQQYSQQTYENAGLPPPQSLAAPTPPVQPHPQEYIRTPPPPTNPTPPPPPPPQGTNQIGANTITPSSQLSAQSQQNHLDTVFSIKLLR